ncbi:MAG: hypothetical protein ACFB10_12005 [Salibacteraceae bacterium]
MQRFCRYTVMKYWFSLCLLSLTISAAFSQSNYLHYHQGINQTEALIVEEQFSEAVRAYDSLFAEYEYVFLKDLLIAAQIAVLSEQPEKTTQWLERALKKGYQCDCITRMPVFEKYIETKAWQHLLDQSEEFKADYYSSIQLQWHREFHQRYKREQESKTASDRSAYISIVSNNYQRIKVLMDSVPFPSERIVGIDNEMLFPSQNGGKLSNCDAANSKVIPTLLHYDNPITDIGWDKFVAALQSGHLHPNQFATIYSFESNYVSRLNANKNINRPELPQYYFQFPFGKKSKDLEKVNRHRAQFGICSIELSEKKKLICRKYRLRMRFGYQ